MPISVDDRPPRREAAIIYLISALTVMAGGSIAPSLGLIEYDLGHGKAEGSLAVRLLLTLPALFTALSAIAFSLLPNRVGKRRVLLGSLFLFGISGLAGAIVAELQTLLATRALLGVAIGGLLTSSMGIIVERFQGDARIKILGRQSATMGLGSIVFLAAGGALALVSWRASFLLYGLALLLIPLTIAWLPNDQPQVSQANASGADSGNGQVATALGFCAFFGTVSYFLAPTIAPFLLTDLGVTSPVAIGAIIGLASISTATMSAGYAWLRDRFGPAELFIASFFIIGLGFSIIWAAQSLLVVSSGIVIAGAGFGIIVPNLGGAVAAAVAERSRPRVIGLVTMASYFGQFLSPVLAEPAVTHGGLRAPFGYAAVILFSLSSVLLLMLRRIATALQLRPD